MPGYQTLNQDGRWRPGGAGRLYVNPDQRPGIGVEQLAIGRNLLPWVQVRSASSLDNQGVGIVPLIAAAIGVVGSVAVPLVQKKLAAKKAKKLAKKEKKKAEAEARKEEEEIAAARALVAPPVSSTSGGVAPGMNWTPLLIGGGAILAAFFLFGRKR